MFAARKYFEFVAELFAERTRAAHQLHHNRRGQESGRSWPGSENTASDGRRG